MRIFVDTGANIRFIRHVQREVEADGHMPASVVRQYLSAVRPVHWERVKRSKRYAGVIMPTGGHNRMAMEMIRARIRSVLDEVMWR